MDGDVQPGPVSSRGLMGERPVLGRVPRRGIHVPLAPDNGGHERTTGGTRTTTLTWENTRSRWSEADLRRQGGWSARTTAG